MSLAHVTSTTTSTSTREHSRRHAESLRRDLAVLVFDYLRQEGMFEAADAVAESTGWDIEEYKVCDNVDLGLVLTDFVNFYQMRFNRYPMICKKRGVEDGTPAKRKVRKPISKEKLSVDSTDGKNHPLL